MGHCGRVHETIGLVCWLKAVVLPSGIKAVQCIEQKFEQPEGSTDNVSILGCTLSFCRKALTEVRIIPDGKRMHGWIGLCHGVGFSLMRLRVRFSQSRQSYLIWILHLAGT